MYNYIVTTQGEHLVLTKSKRNRGNEVSRSGLLFKGTDLQCGTPISTHQREFGEWSFQFAE